MSSGGGIALFIIISAIFVITQYLIFAYVKQLNKEIKDRASHLLLLQTGVTISQYLLAAVIALVILQILFTQEYSILTLYITYAISYGLWIVTLALLARAFFIWHRFSNKDVMVLILTLSMIAHVVNGISGLVTYFYVLGQQKPVITTIDVAYFPTFSIALIGSQVEIINDIASTAAYVLTWIGTIKLLYPYIKKLGEIKFWIIMSAAMLYYLISFPLFAMGYFDPSRDPDAMINILIFSFAPILSGVIFGAAFLSVARTLSKESVLRSYMIIAAYGFLIFYVAGSAMAAQAAFPPYGIVSVSFTGLSCYLIYVGLYSGAITVSQDTALRLSIRKSVGEQTKFLQSMGTAYMEQEVESTVLQIAKKHSHVLTEKTGVEASMSENDIKEYIAMVLNEIHKS